jgi:type VI secretion system FHA domain protein
MEGQQCQFGPEGGTLGRSANNTWVLPDLSRHVSSLHASIRFENGRFIIVDQSTNGLFVNSSAQALGANNTIALNHGDQLSFGDYAIQVSLSQSPDAVPQKRDDPAATQLSAPVPAPSNVSLDDLDKWLEPAVPAAAPQVTPKVSHSLPPLSGAEPLSGVDLGLKPEETDPLVALGGMGARPAQQNAAGALSDLLGGSVSMDQQMMKVPRIIPNDWDDLLGVESVDTDAASSEPAIHDTPENSTGQMTPDSIQPESVPAAPGLDEILSTPIEKLQAAQPSMQESLSEDVLPEDASALQETDVFIGVERVPAEEPPQNTVRPVSAEVPSVVLGARAAEAASSAESTASDTMTAFDVSALARELGLMNLSEAQQAALLTTVANTVKATVSGMMKTLRARSEIKSEFRLNMTTIQSAENNPLKFSVTPEDAIENMFAKQGKAYLPPVEAIHDGFADISDHQVALFDAMKAAYEHIFHQFDPEFLAQKFERNASKRLLGGKARNWDAFQQLYSEYKEDKEQTFKRLFGEVFADAYERRMHSLKMSRGHSSKK